MDTEKVKEEIQVIREMIDKTKRSTAESGSFLILWSIMPILGILGMYVLVFLKQYQWIWLNWVGFMGIGGIISFFLGIGRVKKSSVKTYAQITAWLSASSSAGVRCS